MSRFSSMTSALRFPAFDQLADRVNHLPQRDRRALMALLIFLLLSALYGLWMFHHYASSVEKNALTAQDDLFWLRSQAPLIQAQTESSQSSIKELVDQKAAMHGINVNVVQSGENAQLSATHQNAAVLGNFLAALASDGLVFERAALNQQKNLDIQAEAMVRKAP